MATVAELKEMFLSFTKATETALDDLVEQQIDHHIALKDLKKLLENRLAEQKDHMKVFNVYKDKFDQIEDKVHSNKALEAKNGGRSKNCDCDVKLQSLEAKLQQYDFKIQSLEKKISKYENNQPKVPKPEERMQRIENDLQTYRTQLLNAKTKIDENTVTFGDQIKILQNKTSINDEKTQQLAKRVVHVESKIGLKGEELSKTITQITAEKRSVQNKIDFLQRNMNEVKSENRQLLMKISQLITKPFLIQTISNTEEKIDILKLELNQMKSDFSNMSKASNRLQQSVFGKLFDGYFSSQQRE